MPKYRTIRLPEEDYKKVKKVQRLLRKRGTDQIDWKALREQDTVELPEEDTGDDEDEGEDFTWGFLVGLGAAALAYFLLKGKGQK